MRPFPFDKLRTEAGVFFCLRGVLSPRSVFAREASTRRTGLEEGKKRWRRAYLPGAGLMAKRGQTPSCGSAPPG